MLLVEERIFHRKQFKNKTKGLNPIKNINLLGRQTTFLDKEGNNICIGDIIHVDSCGSKEEGIFFYNQELDEYGIFFRQWYGDSIYDINSYGKFISIPKDNGMRMQIKILKPYNDSI